jgi:hypothetical protein
MSTPDSARLDRIRRRIHELAELDVDTSVFGSETHEWRLGDPLASETITRFEREQGVILPDELRAWLEQVSGSGAGPFYGLLPLPDADQAAKLHLREAFVGDLGDESIDRDPGRRGGYLPLANQGCGYRSVLVLEGPRRGQVLADMREAHAGFLPEAPSFLTWLEDWLERALAEWAERALPELVSRGDDIPLIDELEPLLERRADLDTPETGDIHPYSPVDRLSALMLLRIHRGRLDEAEVLVERIFAIDDRDAEARRQLGLARIAGAREDHEARLAAAERGLAESHWHTTKTSLLRERERALLGLDRRAEAITTMLERADHTRHLHAYYDAAWHSLQAGDLEGAVQVLIGAVELGVGDEAEGSRVEQLERTAAGLFPALEAEGQADVVERLLRRIRMHAAD